MKPFCTSYVFESHCNRICKCLGVTTNINRRNHFVGNGICKRPTKILVSKFWWKLLQKLVVGISIWISYFFNNALFKICGFNWMKEMCWGKVNNNKEMFVAWKMLVVNVTSWLNVYGGIMNQNKNNIELSVDMVNHFNSKIKTNRIIWQ